MTLKELIVPVKTIILKNACFNNITDNWKLRNRKNRTDAEAAPSTKNICGKSTLGKKDHKVVGNENIDLESIYARLAEASSFSENLPSPPNLFTDTSVVQKSSNSVNISEGLDEDDNEDLKKILNEFLNTSDEASVSPNGNRNRLDTFTR